MMRGGVTISEGETTPVPAEESDAWFGRTCYLGVGRPGSVPFVSHMQGAYGHLLLAVYVRWKTGLLVSSEWLRPVMRGGWRVALPDPVRVWLRSAD